MQLTNVGPMSKRGLAIILLCLAPGFGMCNVQQEDKSTAGDQFKATYRMLLMADEARESEKYRTAIDLYRRTLESYAALSRKYPDWQPAVVRFRGNYCDDQVKALLKKINKPEAPEETPAIIDPGMPSHHTVKDVEKELSEIVPRARQLILDGKSSEALAILLEGLRLAPDNETVRLLTGTAQCRERRFDDALHLLKQLVRETPSNAMARVVMGTAYFGLGRTEEAINELRKALDADPSLSEAHFNLARALITLKPPRIKEARDHYSKALSLGAKPDPTLAEALKQH